VNRSGLSACALLVLFCATASPAERVRDGTTVAQRVPQKMLGTWILADTLQCANPTGKIVITSNAVQFGNRQSDRMQFIPKSGAYGGDALHAWIAAKEEILEYDSENDRIIWQSKGAGYYTVEYFERCPMGS